MTEIATLRVAANSNEKPSPRATALPHGHLLGGMGRLKASAYVDVSPSLFDRAVDERLMPKPRQLFGRKVWLREELDAALAALPTTADSDSNPFDD